MKDFSYKEKDMEGPCIQSQVVAQSVSEGYRKGLGLSYKEN